MFPTLPTALTLEGDYGDGAYPFTLLELKLLSMIGSVRDKQRWIEKWQTPDIKAKWLSELTSAIEESDADALAYVEKELNHWASVSKPEISPSAVQGVFQADGIVKEETVKAIRTLFDQLVSVPDSKKDWHPGTTNVLDLVHPSLFCAVVGKTQVIPEEKRGGEEEKERDAFSYTGETHTLTAEDIKPVKPTRTLYSEEFQWLPTEVSVSEDGRASFTSYINNLHPLDHKDGYQAIADVLSDILPLWTETLFNAACPLDTRIDPDMYDLYGPEPDGDDDEAYDDWWENRQPLPEKLPKPPQEVSLSHNNFGGFDEEKKEMAMKHFDLKGKKLQVIVKLGSIELTPDNPSYSGGSWHVEGMQNEAIVATGIYYLDSENVTESRLAFRHAVCEPDYEQSDNPGVEAVYGLQDEDALIQNLGAVTTHEGRLLSFPNHYQHQVSSFELQDKTKPGHRRILCFFLVHPQQRIVSTGIVPPQDPAWFQRVLLEDGALNPMPTDLQKHILKFTSVVPMSLEEAKEYREKLMQERSHFQVQQGEYFAREFSLCEH